MSFRSWPQLARLSNAPTIVSNTLVGWTIGMRPAGGADWDGIVSTTVAMLLLYIGGMALNDVMDVEIDRRERPGRPIPSGAISRYSATLFVVACFAIALGLLARRDWMALAYGFVLMVAIILYNALHVRHAASVILMGLCRGLVYLTAALAAGGTPQWSVLALFAAAIVMYVLLFSLIARRETGLGKMRFEEIVVLAPMFAVIFAEFVPSSAAAWMTILGRGAFLLWTLGIAVYVRSPQRDLGRAVGWWIAGIALLDLYHLTRLDQPLAALIAGACSALALAGQRWIAGS